MRTRRRITQALLTHEGRQFTITFCPDGLHIKERYQRDERVIELAMLVGWSPARSPKAANQSYVDGSPSELLDVAACDLSLVAEALHQKKQQSAEALSSVRESVSQALKIIRSLETLA